MNDDILPEVKPPSSSGLGRHPFKVKVAGSNPAGGTMNRTPALYRVGVRFLSEAYLYHAMGKDAVSIIEIFLQKWYSK